MAVPNVYLFYPNLIGFARVILGIASLFFMQTAPYTAMFMYWLSAFLDAFDGMAARKFNQTTKFGAVLDMVSDRCTTLALMVILAVFYPAYTLFFQLIIVLDIGSHWVHMYSTLTKGSANHKVIDASGNPLLRFYYHNRAVLFFLCAANETFCMGLYFMHFEKGFPLSLFGVDLGAWEALTYFSLPFFALKHALSVVQLVYAVRNIVAIDLEDIAARTHKGMDNLTAALRDTN